MRPVKQLCLILAFLCALPITAVAQTTYGSISGSVTDPNGAVIPGAAIVATHVPTGRQYTLTTTQAGLYVFPDLPPGPYTLSVKQAGFKTYLQTGMEVRVGLREVIDIKLELGTVQQRVEVKATAPLLETANATRGTNMSPQTMANLPLWNGGLRLATNFQSYMPGVNLNGEYSVNGSTGRAGEYLIDGASIVSPESGGTAFYFPGFEPYGEFKMITSGFTAEDGRVGGGIQEYVTKSGGNHVHGSAFFNFKRQFLDAVSWANNQNPASRSAAPCIVPQAKACRPKERYNEEGGTAGGPVYIPHIYDGRDKTFFFFTYAGFWQPATVSVSTGLTTPTAAMLQGNFQALVPGGANGTTTPYIYDPASAAANGGVRQPFGSPGAYNIIPSNRFSTISKNIIPYIPAPNAGTGLIGNFAFNNTSVTTDLNWSAKIDHTIKTKNRIAFFYDNRKNPSNSVTYFPGPLSDGLLSINHPHIWRMNDDYTINPHWLLHSFWGFTQDNVTWQDPLQNGFGSKFGFNNYPAGSNSDAMPIISFQTDLTVPSGLGSQSTFYNCATCLTWGMDQGKVNNSGQWNWTTTVGQSLMWIHSKHEFKMGWEIRRNRTVSMDWAGTNGTYAFAGYQTAATSGSSTTGNAFASFLLGDVNLAGQNSLPIFPVQTRYGYHAGYFQDTWRLRPKFTLNLGVRYEVPIGWHNVVGNYSSFSPTATDPTAGNLPGALIFMGSGPNRTGTLRPYPTDFSDIGPRVGFAWQTTSTLVVRGGFGIFYEALGNGGCGCEDGFSGSFSQLSDGFNPAFQWDGTGGKAGVQPPATYVPPPVVNPGYDNFNTSLYFMGPHFGKAPVIYDLNVTLQKTYKSWLFEGAYVETRSHGLATSEYMNALPTTDLYLENFSYGGTNYNLLAQNITTPQVQCGYYNNCASGAAPILPFPNFMGWKGSSTLGQALRPFPQYGNIYSANSGDGRTWYDAFQGKIEHRFGDLNMTTSYVFSKTLDQMAYRQIFLQCCVEQTQDAYNIRDSKTFAYEDTPNFINIMASYRLPLGRGKKYLPNAHGVLDKVASGWIVSLLSQYRSGTLIQLTSPSNFLGSYLYDPITKANYNGLPIKTNVATNTLDPNNASIRWLNYGTNIPFTQAPLGTIGNTSIFNTNVRNPWFRNENMSINKEIKIWESVQLKYSVNAFNLFNRTDFGGITTSLTSTNFGRPSGPMVGARAITMGLRLEF